VSKWNESAALALRTSEEQSLGKDFASLPLAWDWDRVLEGLEKCRAQLQPVKINSLWYERANDKEGFLFLGMSPILDEQGELEGVLMLGTDITDFRVLEAQLSQAQKLESIGQLAAGIAHEINTPAQYVGDTVTFLRDSTADLMRALDMVAELHSPALHDEACTVEAVARVRAALEEADYTFLKEEMPKSFARALEGIERVSAIVQAMRSFSHPGEIEKKAVDINQAIESTIIVSRNEWKYVAAMETDLDPNLPRVVCLPAEMNQVLLNLVVNASHAVGDVVRSTQTLGVLRVATALEDNHVRISITDSGTGIPEAFRNKIFDPFFTTKEVGKGTGQGLAMAYDIVVNKHGGTISFDTEEGRGTTFHIRLPLSDEATA
jgi:signal transduction histidine kinase